MTKNTFAILWLIFGVVLAFGLYSIRVKNGRGQGHLAFNVVTWFLWMTIVGLILGYFVD